MNNATKEKKFLSMGSPILYRLSFFSLSLLIGVGVSQEEKSFSGLRLLEYNDSAGEPLDDSEKKLQPPFRRVKSSGNLIDFQYGFRSFREQVLVASFKIDQAALDKSIAEFGYRDDELDAIDAWFEKTQAQYQKETQSKGVSGVISATSEEELERKMAEVQERNKKLERELERKLKDLKNQYEKKRADYFVSKKFKLLPENVVAVNMPELVKANFRRLFPLAVEFDRLAMENDFASEDIISAVAAMVQTSIDYKVPPTIVGKRHTGGVWSPLEALSKGWGDCDTKTAVLASVLLNWDQFKAIGVGLPGHYLMGVQHIPGRGDAFVEYEGSTYVLVEPAGPAWAPPGLVSEQTLAKLELAQGVTLEPFSGD